MKQYTNKTRQIQTSTKLKNKLSLPAGESITATNSATQS